MRKLLSVILCLVPLAVPLTGCAGKTPPMEPAAEPYWTEKAASIGGGADEILCAINALRE